MGNINYELLDFTMKYIETNPERHDQGTWFKGELEVESGTHVADMDVCGTAGCFAGWASVFAGYHQLRPHVTDECGCDMCATQLAYDVVVDETGAEQDMRSAATQALGLTSWQADRMFAGDNSRDDLKEYVDRLHNDPTDTLS